MDPLRAYCECAGDGNEDDDTYRWLSAIKNNDLVYVTDTLLYISDHQREALLNGRFTKLYDDMGARAGYFVARYRVDNAVLAAVVNGSRDVLQCLLDHGADPLITDDRGDNIAHTVISVVATHPKLEDSQLNNLRHFLAILPVNKSLKLLKTENKLHLRPLEYALSKGLITIFRCIFETQGVYVCRGVQRGYASYEEYDITEYEEPERCGRSPLLLLCLTNEKTMLKPEFVDLLNWPPMRQWLVYKVKAAYVPCAIWAATVLWYAFVYYLIKNNQPSNEGGIPDNIGYENMVINGSFIYCAGSDDRLLEFMVLNPNILRALIIYGMVHSVFIIVFDIVEFIRIRHYRMYWSIVKDGLMSRHVFMPHFIARFLIHFGVWGIFIYYIMLLRGVSVRGNTMFSIFNLITDIGLFAYVSYVILAISLMGYYANLIAGLFLDMLYFSVLGLITTIPYTVFFNHFVNTNTLEGCIEDFSDFGRTMYRVIQIMLNIRDMTQYKTTANTAFLIAHFISTSVLGVLFLNFFIASMTIRVSTMACMKDVMIPLCMFPVTLTIDSRMNGMFTLYSAYCRRKYINMSSSGRTYLTYIRTLHRQS